MNKHSLDYVDMHPEPLTEECPEWLLWLGASVTMVGFCAVVALLFSLVGGS